MSDYDGIEFRISRMAGEQVWAPTYEPWRGGTNVSWRKAAERDGSSLDVVLSELSPDEYKVLRPQLEEMANELLQRAQRYATTVTEGGLVADEVVTCSEGALRCSPPTGA